MGEERAGLRVLLLGEKGAFRERVKTILAAHPNQLFLSEEVAHADPGAPLWDVCVAVVATDSAVCAAAGEVAADQRIPIIVVAAEPDVAAAIALLKDPLNELIAPDQLHEAVLMHAVFEVVRRSKTAAPREKIMPMDEMAAQMRAQFLALPVPAFVWREHAGDFQLVDHNTAATEFSQGVAPSFVGKLASQMYPDRPDILEDLTLCFRERKTLRREMAYCMQVTGDVRCLDVTYAFAEPDLVVVYADDITAHKQNETLFQVQRDLALALSRSIGLKETLRLCTLAAINASQMDAGGVYLINATTGALDLIFHTGFTPAFVRAVSHFDADAPNVRLILSGQPLYYGPSADPQTQTCTEEQLKAIAIVPFCHEGRVIGCLNLASRQYDTIPQYARSAIETIAGQIGHAIAREQALAAVRDHEANLNAFFETVQDLLIVLDESGIIRQANRAVTERLGYLESELIGQSVLKIHPPPRRKEAAVIVTSMTQGACARCEIPLLAKDGTQIPVETCVVRGRWNGQPALFGISRDVSRREFAEDALRASEERYRSLVQYSPHAIIVVDGDSLQFLDANPGAEKTFGLSRDELLAKGPMDLSPTRQPSGVVSTVAAQEWIERTLEGECPTFEWLHLDAEGRGIPCEVTLTRIPSPDRRLIRASIVDIQMRKETERVLDEQRAKMAAAARLSALGVMAGGVAHEINNPLAIISGGVEQLQQWIEESGKDLGPVASGLEKIARNAERIERIVQGLQRLSHDGSSDPFVSASLRTIIDDVVELCRSRFKVAEVELSVEAPSRSVLIECVPAQIAQVLLDLLGNAFDAARETQERWVRLDVNEHPERIEIAVTDSGQGLAPEVAEHLFEPFFTTKPVGYGTGLGLSISASAIDHHHGQLVIDSESPNTRFVVSLPRKRLSMDLSEGGT